MFQALQAAWTPAVMERLTLMANHVLHGEASATSRLRPHTGRFIGIELRDWPSPLPQMPTLVFRVTPAGLLEWCPDKSVDDADLRVGMDASNPALALVRGLVGERPRVDIQGDAALASDVNWLVENLRWDVEDDLERVVGPVPARELARLGRRLSQGLRTAVQALAGERRFS